LREEGFVAFRSGRRWQAAEGNRPDALEAELIAEALVRGPENVIDDQKAVARMAGDVGDLIGMQAQVQRMNHAARQWHPEIRFEVRRVTPHERRHAVAAREARLLKRSCEPANALFERGIFDSGKRAVRTAGNNLDLGKIAAGALED
jgi:hypothetical protein